MKKCGLARWASAPRIAALPPTLAAFSPRRFRSNARAPEASPPKTKVQLPHAQRRPQRAPFLVSLSDLGSHSLLVRLQSNSFRSAHSSFGFGRARLQPSCGRPTPLPSIPRCPQPRLRGKHPESMCFDCTLGRDQEISYNVARMITYTLTYDEFQEQYQHRLEATTFESLCALGVIALLVSIDLVLVIETIQPSYTDIGSRFGIAVLALFAPLLVSAYAQRRIKQEVRQLQLSYQYTYSGERSLSFNIHEWVVRTTSGQQKGHWTNRLTAYESSTLISLVPMDQLPLIVPKRAVSSEDALALHFAVFGNVNYGFESSVSLADYFSAMALLLWKQHPLLLAAAHLSGFFLVTLLATHVRDSASKLIAGAICSGFLVAVLILPFLYLLVKYENSDRGTFANWKASILSQGLQVRTRSAEFFCAWELFTGLKETSRCLVFLVTSRSYYIIPKRFVPAEQQLLFRQRATKKG